MSRLVHGDTGSKVFGGDTLGINAATCVVV